MDAVRRMMSEFFKGADVAAGSPYTDGMNTRSPFPGLDPWLEAHWGDVHHSLSQYTRDALQEQIPGDLIARVEERVFVEDDDIRVRTIAPDVLIGERKPFPGQTFFPADVGGVALAEPKIFVMPTDETVQGYIEIRERNGNRVITVIEFLSPSNKLGGTGQRLYKEKQQQVLESTASLVEIDLVRAGQRVLALSERNFPAEWRNCAQACISRSWNRPDLEAYGFPLREPLPALLIPLRPHEPPVILNLQAILDECYRKGRYHHIDYSRPPEPPLNADDAEWADAVLKAAGRRT